MKKKEIIQPRRQCLEKAIGDFCENYINDEYKNICHLVVEKMSRKRQVPYMTGRVEVWAAGIIHAIGRVNFLYHKKTSPYISMDQLAEYFNTSKRTVGPKAKIIINMFKMSYFDPVFSTRSIQEKSPSSEFIQIGNYIYRKSQVEAELMNQLGLFCDSD